MEPIERTIHGILLCGIALSVALMAAGLVLGVGQGGRTSTRGRAAR